MEIVAHAIPPRFGSIKNTFFIMNAIKRVVKRKQQILSVLSAYAMLSSLGIFASDALAQVYTGSFICSTAISAINKASQTAVSAVTAADQTGVSTINIATPIAMSK